jgi:hypothetical protein
MAGPFHRNYAAAGSRGQQFVMSKTAEAPLDARERELLVGLLSKLR